MFQLDPNDPGGTPVEGGNDPSGTGDPQGSGPDAGGGTPQDAFYDASKVPPELQSTFKEMQGSLTKKTQALAEERRAFQTEQQELSDKAQRYDYLMGNNLVVDFLHRLDQAYRRGEDPSQIGLAQGLQNGQEDPMESLDPSVRSAIEAKYGSLEQEIGQLKAQQANLAEARAFEAKYPKWRDHQDALVSLVQREPNLPIERAYLSVLGEKYLKGELTKAQVNEAARATVERPKGSPEHDFVATNDAGGTPEFQDALRKAMTERGWDPRTMTPPR